jgi:NDP-sugar pyrophosphorylase family protein
MDAVIMAGGKGTRLLPYTETMPKPLLPLGKDRIIEILLRQLRRHGVNHVIITLGHLAVRVPEALGDGARFGLEITYLREDYPRGSCGSLAAVIDRLGDNFILANGDLLTDADLSAMLAEHERSLAGATVGVFSHTERIPYGVLTIGAEGTITAYDEKPARSVDISMGIYILRRQAVRPFLQGCARLDMPELLQAMIASGERVAAFRGTRLWMDIGTPSEYRRASELIASNPQLIEPAA